MVWACSWAKRESHFLSEVARRAFCYVQYIHTRARARAQMVRTEGETKEVEIVRYFSSLVGDWFSNTKEKRRNELE